MFFLDVGNWKTFWVLCCLWLRSGLLIKVAQVVIIAKQAFAHFVVVRDLHPPSIIAKFGLEMGQSYSCLLCVGTFNNMPTSKIPGKNHHGNAF